MKKSIEIISAAALLLVGLVSCNKTEIVEKEVAKPAIEFVNAGDKNVVIPFNTTEAVTISIKNNFKAADLMIEAKSGEDWCTAAFDGENKIVITPNETGIKEDKTATFVVKGAPESKATTIEEHITYVPEAVEFTVSREKTEFQDKAVITLTDAPEGNVYEMEAGAKTLTVAMTANFDINKLNIVQKAPAADAAKWEAIITDENTIKVNAPETASAIEAIEATFSVESVATKGIIEVPIAVEFKVTRPATDPAVTSLEGNGLVEQNMGMIMYELNVPAEGGDFTIKVNTNGPDWFITDMMNDNYWMFDPTTGKNGTETTVTIWPNQMTEEKTSMFVFTTEKEGMTGMMLTIKQAAKQAIPATAVAVNKGGEELTTGSTITLAKAGGKDNAIQLLIECTPADGEIDFNFCKPGTTEADPNAENIAGIGISSAENANYQIVPYKNATGKERKLDFVIFAKGTTTELFRIHLVQPGEEKPAGKPATGVSVKRFGQEQTSGFTNTPFNAAGGVDFAFKASFTAIPAGSEMEFRFCKPNTMEEYPNVDEVVKIEEYPGMFTTHAVVPSANTSGQPRAYDLVILGAGTENELFRIHFTQEA